MNYWILAVLILQALIARAHPRAGAIVGLALSAGVLLWGAAAYASGGGIVFFGFPLRGGVFAMLMLVWIRYDVVRLQRVFASSAARSPEAVDNRVAKVADAADGPMPGSSGR